MTHRQHKKLLEKAIPNKKSVWADFGSGDGAFTLALADFLDKNSEIYSIDMNRSALTKQKVLMEKMFPHANVTYMEDDFTRFLSLPQLDGIVIANALHFYKDKHTLLQMFSRYLAKNGRLVVIEYNADTGNQWVPHPLSFPGFVDLAKETGFIEPVLLETVPSFFLKEIYSALTFRVH